MTICVHPFKGKYLILAAFIQCWNFHCYSLFSVAVHKTYSTICQRLNRDVQNGNLGALQKFNSLGMLITPSCHRTNCKQRAGNNRIQGVHIDVLLSYFTIYCLSKPRTYCPPFMLHKVTYLDFRGYSKNTKGYISSHRSLATHEKHQLTKD